MLTLERKAEPLRNLPEGEELSRIDLAAALARPEVRRAFLQALKDLNAGFDLIDDFGQTPLQKIAGALALGDYQRVLDLIPWARLEPALLPIYQEPEGLLRAVESGGRMGLRLLPSPPPPMDPDRLRALAIEHLRSVGASRVTGITEESRTAMRLVLEEAYGKPRRVAATAKDIRIILDAQAIRGLAGINTLQAVGAKRAGGLAKKILAWTEDPDISAARARQLIARESKRLLKQRAKLIAVTEAYDAGNAGLVEVWREGAAQGHYRLRLGQFVDKVGPRKGETVTAPRPPLHPGCYCTLRLVRQELGGVVYYVPEWVARVVGACPRCEALDGALAA